MANLHHAPRRELPAALPDVGHAAPAWSGRHRVVVRSHRDACDRAACRHRFRVACRRLVPAARGPRRHAARTRRRHATRKRCRHAARSHASRCERARRCRPDHAGPASPASGSAAGSSRRSARWRFAMKMTHLTVAAFTAAGCASTSPRPSFEQVSKLVEERGGKPLHWDEGTPADAQVQAHVRDLLRGTLTPDGAVEVALLRNQGLVATYEELGVAQADLVEAGLLRNPTVGARVRFPTGAGLTATEFSVAQDFLSLLTLPMRKRVAAAQLDASKARVGSAVLDLTAEVRGAFVGLQAAQATAKVRQLVLDAQQAAAELRRRQHAAGNVGDLELVQEEAFYQQAKLELARAQTQVLEQRERVNRLLGLWGEESTSWKVSDELPALPAGEPALEHVESVAVARRLDLAAAHSEAQALEQAASAAGVTRFIH